MLFNQAVSIFTIILGFTLTGTSPNKDNEVGNESKDVPLSKEMTKKKKYIIIGVFHAVMSIMILNYIHTYADNPLGFYDYLLLTIFVLAISTRLWCYYILGRFFTFNLGIRENHHLIQDGPYKYLIHPSYTGELFKNLTTLLFFRVSLYVAIPLMGFIIFNIYKRCLREEKMLKSHFGDEKWKKHTIGKYRLISYIF